jgi:alginate O-acetyltransferase complex protein AlgI
MLFSSPVFFAFFVVYFAFHLLVPIRYRVYLIICGSTIFYAWWKVEYAWLPYALMAIGYGGARWIEGTKSAGGRRARAATAIVLLFLPLVFFKYTNFIYEDVLGPITGTHGKLIELSLPLGVSFVTFSVTAYVIDIYRGAFPADHRPSTVLAYVLFFPHLIAGPILRPHELIPQIVHPRATPRRWSVPIAIFTIGLVKKLVFADQIGNAVDAVYSVSAGAPSAPSALLAIYGFSVQIYCDFSGYTDMAIGLALLLGVRLPNNFARPYCAHSIVEFWRRWHITLSFWLRDYLYIPLGGNRHGRLREIANILVTMALGGLWHGANWTFVIWGVLHGIGVAFVHLLGRTPGASIFRAIPQWLAVLITFHFVTLAWVFFRASTLEQALTVLQAPFTASWGNLASFASGQVFYLLLLTIFFISHGLDDHRHVKALVRYLRGEIFWPLMLLCWVLAITVSQGNSAKFIYFEF